MPRGGYEVRQKQLRAASWTGLDHWSMQERPSVRAGYGIYYDTSPLAPGEALYFNRPYFDFNLFFPAYRVCL